MAHTEEPINTRILVGKSEGKRQIRRHRIQSCILKGTLNQFGMETFVSVDKLVPGSTEIGKDT
jgi:hypothetical protein